MFWPHSGLAAGSGGQTPKPSANDHARMELEQEKSKIKEVGEC